jgi:short-subunit dehydrogenase
MKIIPGQVALITGASRGLGVYIAKTFARYGVNMMISARSETELKALESELLGMGIEADSCVADVANNEDLQRLYTTTMTRFGHIDYLINNAGVETWGKYKDLSFDEVQKVLDVNLTAPMRLSHLALPDMYERNQGHIVNIASAAGFFPPPYSEPYGTTKAGLIGFTQSLRLSAQVDGSKVSASCVAPGYMDDAGMYEEMKQVGDKVSWLIGSLPAQALADAIIKAIETDKPVHILMPWSPKLLKIVQIIAPRLFEVVCHKLGIFKPIIQAAEVRTSNR